MRANKSSRKQQGTKNNREARKFVQFEQERPFKAGLEFFHISLFFFVSFHFVSLVYLCSLTFSLLSLSFCSYSFSRSHPYIPPYLCFLNDMPTIYLLHRSKLVSYFVAVSLQLYFRHRQIRIVIVELLDKKCPIIDSRPFCGASTVSNLRLTRWIFFQKVVLARALGQVLVFADLVQVHEGPTQNIGDPFSDIHGQNRARQLRPELPLWAQQLRVLARQGDFGRFLAVFYLPQVVEAALYQHLSQSPMVLFMSVQNLHQIPKLVGNLSRNNDPNVWFHFAPGDIDNRHLDLDVLASSRLCALEVESAHQLSATHSSGPIERRNWNQHTRNMFPPRSHKFPGQTPAFDLPPGIAKSILWLPLFKGAANMFSEPILSHSIHNTRNHLMVTVSPLNLNENEESFAARHDLLYAVKTSDFVLETVENLLGEYRLDVSPLRL